MDLTAENMDVDVEVLVKELRIRVAETKFKGGIIPRTDDNFLAKFIRTKDCKMDKALDSVRKYYANIHRNFKFIEGIRPSQFQTALESNYVTVFKHAFQGSRAAVFRIRNWNLQEIGLRDVQLATVFIAEQYIQQVDIQEKGLTVIFDLEGLRFEHVWKFTVKEIRRCVKTGLEGLPARVTGIHFLHPPPLFWSIYQIVQRFLKAKIRDRVHLHYSLDTLHEYFDKAFLPESLGGDLTEAEAAETNVIKDLLEYDVPYEEYWNGEIWKHNLKATAGV